MKIERIEVIPFGVPIRSFADAYTGFSVSNAVLVKIYTDEGHIGYGEACAWEPEFYGETLESVSTTIEKYIAPRITGEDPRNINRILSIIDANLAKITCAKEGVDLALHDLVGKILDVPVYMLLGGKYRDMIPVASEIGIDTPAEMVKNAREVLDLGIKVIKIKGSSNHVLDCPVIKFKYSMKFKITLHILIYPIKGIRVNCDINPRNRCVVIKRPVIREDSLGK